MGSGMEGVSAAGLKRLSQEAVVPFREGIGLILSKWSALQLAVENEWGGRGSRQIAEQLHSDILSWFTQSKEPLYIDDLENLLEEAMISLNVEIGDGSIEEVAYKLMVMHKECLEGNYSLIEKMRQSIPQRVNHQHIEQVADDEEDDEEDNGMEVDEASIVRDPAEMQSSSGTKPLPNEGKSKESVQAEDGWVVVPSRRSKGKRN